MNDTLTKEGIKYLIARLLERAKEANEERRDNPEDNFQAGRNMAYYEMLDILKTELDIREQDLGEFGLNINLEKTFLSR